MFRDLGNRLGQAEALNRLGELSSRTSATGQAREHHTRALAIARDIGVPSEEARALEGLGGGFCARAGRRRGWRGTRVSSARAAPTARAGPGLPVAAAVEPVAGLLTEGLMTPG